MRSAPHPIKSFFFSLLTRFGREGAEMNRFCPDFFTFVTIKIKSFVAVGFGLAGKTTSCGAPSAATGVGKGGETGDHWGGPAPWYWAEGGAPKMPKGRGFLVLGPPGMSSAAPGVLGGGPNVLGPCCRQWGGHGPIAGGDGGDDPCVIGMQCPQGVSSAPIMDVIGFYGPIEGRRWGAGCL